MVTKYGSCWTRCWNSPFTPSFSGTIGTAPQNRQRKSGSPHRFDLAGIPLWKMMELVGMMTFHSHNMVGKSFQPAMFQSPPSSFWFKQRPIRPALNACQRLYQTLASSTVFSRGKVTLKLIHENITWRAEKPFGRFWSGIDVWMGLMISIHIYIHSFVFYVYVYIYIHTSMCIHICIYIYIYVYIHTYTRIYMYICI